MTKQSRLYVETVTLAPGQTAGAVQVLLRSLRCLAMTSNPEIASSAKNPPHATKLVFRLRFLDHDRGAVRQDLCDSFHHLIGIVTHPDHRVRTNLLRVLHHQFECLAARVLT